MRRVHFRQAVLVAALAAGGTSLSLVACGDPYAETQNAGPETSTPEAGLPDATPDVVADVPVGADAGQPIDAAGCVTCDCDDDGYNDLAKAGCADAGGLA